MIRTLLATAALAAVASTANAQGYGQGYGSTYGSDADVAYMAYAPAYDSTYASDADVAGLTVYAQPRDAYVIHISTWGKDVRTVHREINEAAYTACRLAPRTGNTLDTRPSSTSACVTDAIYDARRQFERILDQRRNQGYVYTAAY
jgi:hypothetical protein